MAQSHTVIWNSLKLAIDIVVTGLLANTAFITTWATYLAGLTGDRGPDGGAAARALRTTYAGLIDINAAMLDPHITELQEATGYPEVGAIDDTWWEYYRDFLDTAGITFQSRNLTFGTPTPTGTGTGVLVRQTLDRHNNPIEAIDLTTYTVRCENDQFSGTEPGQESFTLRQNTQEEDRLIGDGGGQEGTTVLATSSGDDYVANASFQTLDDPNNLTAPIEIPSWEWDGTPSTDLAYDDVDFFRSSPEELSSGIPLSLIVKASGTLTQVFGRGMDRLVPVVISFLYNREVGTAGGTITLSLGNLVATPVVLAAELGWNRITMVAWFDQVVQTDVKLTITFGALTGLLRIDGFEVHDMLDFGGIPTIALPGDVDFVVLDEFSYADVLAAGDSKNQRILAMTYGRKAYLPSTTGAPTITDAA